MPRSHESEATLGNNSGNVTGNNAMAAEWEQYNFYRALEVEPEASAPEIQEAHRTLTSTLNPDAKPPEQKRAAAIAFVTAEAALQTLCDDNSRKAYDSLLAAVQKAEGEREKIEASRAGKLQEEQSIEEDEQLKKAALKLEAARNSLAEFYYEHLFKAARESRFSTVAPEKLVAWLSAERAESVRKIEQEGRRVSFRIEMEGFAAVQEMRKKRSDEIVHIVDDLVEKFHLP